MTVAHIGTNIEDRPSAVSRRRFLQVGALASGGLLIGVQAGFGKESSKGGEFLPNAFIRILPDDSIVVTIPYVEMGQGTYTTMTTLIAEELDADISKITVEHAPPDDKKYGNPILGGVQATGGSTSTRAAWGPLRQAGAGARALLVQAAANRWKVDPNECSTESGRVMHARTDRSVTYGNLAGEASKLNTPSDVQLKPKSRWRFIGKPIRRLDIAGKIDGTAKYGIDALPAGVLIATLSQSPVLGGKVSRVDDHQARAVRGVRQIVVLDDAVAVVAEHMGAAKKGLVALKIQWDEGANTTLSTQQLLQDLNDGLSADPGAVATNVGDVTGSLKGAARKVEASYHVPFLAHAALEPMNCTVHVRQSDCEIWVGTQVLSRAQAVAAEVTGLPLEKVTVHNHLIGGGFGRRLEVDGIKRAVQIAKEVQEPVKVIWTREEDMQHDMYRPMFADRLVGGLDANGKLVAWSHSFAGSSILARWLPPAFAKGLDPETIDGAANPVYAFPNHKFSYLRLEPKAVPTAFWRSVGPSHNIFVMESFVDELAVAAGRDPVEFRLELLRSNPRASRVLEAATKKANSDVAGSRAGARTGRGVSVQSVFGSFMAQVADVEVLDNGDVRVQKVVCAVDCGQVINPSIVRAQIEGAIIFGVSAALYGDITLTDGKIDQSNFDDYKVVRMDEAPPIEVVLLESDEQPGGMGEPGTSAIVPAISNAIYSATKVRLRSMPVDRNRLKK
jgi:isoquinoline 1-oxidoreductase beta subunit